MNMLTLCRIVSTLLFDFGFGCIDISDLIHNITLEFTVVRETILMPNFIDSKFKKEFDSIISLVKIRLDNFFFISNSKLNNLITY